ncbi:MAG: hypothetical protein AB8I08_05975 [Sandaracinaceae bacterium]
MAAPVSTEGPAWDGLRDAVRRLSALSGADTVSLHELGKAYATLARSMLEVTAAAGQTSVRYRVIDKALDLRTKKSELMAFVDE